MDNEELRKQLMAASNAPEQIEKMTYIVDAFFAACKTQAITPAFGLLTSASLTGTFLSNGGIDPRIKEKILKEMARKAGREIIILNSEVHNEK